MEPAECAEDAGGSTRHFNWVELEMKEAETRVLGDAGSMLHTAEACQRANGSGTVPQFAGIPL
jgi:hypothetical protein